MFHIHPYPVMVPRIVYIIVFCVLLKPEYLLIVISLDNEYPNDIPSVETSHAMRPWCAIPTWTFCW